jgi:hypothetical protein
VLYFDKLASFEPIERSSWLHAYQAWDPAHPDGLRGLAFAVQDNRRGRAFVALMEEAVRRHRPDLLRGHRPVEWDIQAGRLLEPPELWPGDGGQASPTSQRLGAVLGEVYRRGRRKPEAQVRDLLEQELQQAGLTWEPKLKEEFVRDLANKPPFLVGALWRLVPGKRRQPQPVDRHTPLEPPEDPEMDPLVEHLLALPGVWRVGWHSAAGRAVDVWLYPWSEETAGQIRQLVTPRMVRFRR